ncbi:hypothetical protein BMS3Abin03_02367 [bacterium BMS3Abin03]|nr:hypothetical protein BMS3Abin03_02367 [bacterium BMS3Abin03]
MNNQIPVENKMEKHLTVVAALQVGFSLLGILAAIIVYTVLRSVVGFVEEPEGEKVLMLVATWVPLFLIIVSIPGLIGGIGLFMKQRWARILVLVISVLDLLNIPVGTAVAVYSIWVLVQEDTVKLFTEQPTVS